MACQQSILDLLQCCKAEVLDGPGLDSTAQFRTRSILHAHGSSALVARLKLSTISAAVTSSESWRILAARSHTIEQLCDHKNTVTVVRCMGEEIGEVAFKHIPCQRAVKDAKQIEAEGRARTLLPDGHPLLVKPLTIQKEKRSIFMTNQFAGDSVAKLLTTKWSSMTLHRRIELSRDMIACMLLALHDMSKLQEPQLYRDFKLENICCDHKWHIFRLIDFGLLMSASKQDFHPGFTMHYLDPALAGTHNNDYILNNDEAMAAASTPALDIWTLFVAALQLMLLTLPRQLDYARFAGEYKEEEFLTSLSSWDPAKCPELQTMRGLSAPAASAVDFIQRGLQRNPDDRVTVEQAMQDPWIADKVAAVQQKVLALSPACLEQQRKILNLYPASAKSSSIPEMLASLSSSHSSSNNVSFVQAVRRAKSRISGEDAMSKIAAECTIELAVIGLAAHKSFRLAHEPNGNRNSSITAGEYKMLGVALKTYNAASSRARFSSIRSLGGCLANRMAHASNSSDKQEVHVTSA